MKKVFTVLAGVLLLAVIAQFYLAASGAFDTAPNAEAFEPHRLLGNSIIGYSIVVVITAAAARMPGRLIGLAGLVAGLVVVQSLIRELAKALGDGSTTGQLVFGAHAINGLVIVSVIGMVVRESRRISWQRVEPSRMAS